MKKFLLLLTMLIIGVVSLYATQERAKVSTQSFNVHSTTEFLSSTNAAEYDNVIYAENVDVHSGSEFILPILMKNTKDFIGFQFELVLPQGFSIKLDENDKEVYRLNNARLDNAVEISFTTLYDKSVRIVGFPFSNPSATINGTTGEILYLTLVADDKLAVGSYEVLLKNIFMQDSKPELTEVSGTTSIINICSFEHTDYSNVIYAENVEIRSGQEFVLPVLMCNTEDIISFQVDFYLPEGIIAKVDEEGYLFTEKNSERLKRSFQLESAITPEGYVRVLCYSSKNDAIVGTEGEIFNITLLANETIAEGEYEISYKNIVMTKTDAMTAFEVAHVKSVVTVTNFVLGDVNDDGKINVSDVSGIVSMLLAGDSTPYSKSADVNEDGKINVSDVSGVVNMLLSGVNSNKLNVPALRPIMKTYNEATSFMFIEPFQINPGEEKEILVNFNNPDLEVISFQFDLQLPEGIEVVYDEDEEYYLVEAGSRLKRSYVVDSNKFENGIFRVLAYSQKNEPVKGTSGDIIKLTVKAADTLADSIYTLNFMETTLTKDVEGKSVSVYPENTSCAISVGNATGINSINATGKNQAIYDLYGRATSAKQRGVYIINGKKVIK